MTLSRYADPYLAAHSANRITKATVRALVAYFGERDYAHCTSADWLEFFKTIPRASLATLRRYRSTILTFLQSIADQGETDVSVSVASLKALDVASVIEELKSTLLRGHFGSYDEMMDLAERSYCKGGQEPPEAQLMYTMLTLVWFGVPWREALSIRKEDVVVVNDRCIIQGRCQIQNPRAIRYIVSYRDAVQAYGVKNNRTLSYPPSPFLFRAFRSPQVSEASILVRVSQLSGLVPGGAYFTLDKVHQSAVFVRSFALISNMGLEVTPALPGVLRPYLVQLLDLSPAEIADDRARGEAWELFYRWCEKYRTVSPE